MIGEVFLLRRDNYFDRGVRALLCIAIPVLTLILAWSLVHGAALRNAEAARPRMPGDDRRPMPEMIGESVSSGRPLFSQDEPPAVPKPSPEWTFYVLEYHNFTLDPAQATPYTITLDALRRDLDWLRGSGYTTILPRELAAGRLDSGGALPQKAVLLTFDDGYESNYTLAYPVLREYGAKAAVSLITARIDGGAKGFLSWPECRVMAGSGLVEFASHTNDLHLLGDVKGIERLAGETQEDYAARVFSDLKKSVDRISGETGQTPTAFTYPLGNMDAWAEDFLHEHFAVTFAGGYAPARYGDSLYRLPRYNITDDHPASEYLPE